MERNIDTLYVVTGISRLTGEREAVSKPTLFLIAVALRSKWKRKPARKRAYLYLKVESYNQSLYEK